MYVNNQLETISDYQKNCFHSKEDVLRISDQLESVSTKQKTYCSQTIGSNKYENIYNDNYVRQKQNRRLKYELKREKSKKGKSYLGLRVFFSVLMRTTF